jgi:hypothetical protein
MEQHNSTNEENGLLCPVCCFMARDANESSFVRKNGACNECYTNFRHVMGSEWDEGKRPTVQEARNRMEHIIRTGGDT